jgi:poly(A) polymerase
MIGMVHLAICDQPTAEHKNRRASQAENAAKVISAYLRQHDTVIAPAPLLSGSDLLQGFQLEPGPQIGQILQSLREEQAAGTVSTQEEARAFVREGLQANAFRTPRRA